MIAEEEDKPKENPPTPLYLVSAKNAVIKEKSSLSHTNETSYFLSSVPLSQYMDLVKPLIVEEEDKPKENPPTPP